MIVSHRSSHLRKDTATKLFLQNTIYRLGRQSIPKIHYSIFLIIILSISDLNQNCFDFSTEGAQEILPH